MVKLQNWVVALLRRLEEEVGAKPGDLVFTSVAFTLEVYSHVLPHMQETAAMKVEALLQAA